MGAVYGERRDVSSQRAVVIGSGPNGLSAAIELARHGREVLVLEGAPEPGGGLRSAALTLPGFVHDPCASVLALLVASPVFSRMPLRGFGLDLIGTNVAVAHPFDDGTAAVLYRSLAETAAGLGHDGAAWHRLLGPLVTHGESLMQFALGPLALPRAPLLAARLGLPGLLPATVLSALVFRGPRARGLFAGLAAHAVLPLERPISSAFGLVLAVLGHTVGFPIARGGSQRAADALARYLGTLGGRIQTSTWVDDVSHLSPGDVVLADLAPRGVLGLGGTRLAPQDRRALGRFRHGAGVFKIDWALDDPIPWTAPGCRQAMTVHLGGTLEDIARGERQAWAGQHAAEPFVILTQPTIVDPTRAPAGKHTAWAYCHVPHGSHTAMVDAIENQVERFAPGFRQRILARASRTATDMQTYNPNYVGGDINGGVQDLGQLWTRPTARLVPYRTSDPRVFVCSSSTPPGGGVHGMCGYFAARAALGDTGGLIR